MGDRRATLVLLLILCLVLPTFYFPMVKAAEDSWTTMEPMPTARSGLGVAVVDGKIFAIGGFNGSYLATNEMYDPETDMWTTRTSAPTLVDTAVACATTGILAPKRIYLLGGMGDQLNVATNINQVYDPEADAWANGTSMPTSRWSLAAAVVNDEIYAIGGYNGDSRLAVNEKYTPTGYIPEFPSWIILPLFVLATLTMIFVRNKIQRKD